MRKLPKIKLLIRRIEGMDDLLYGVVDVSQINLLPSPTKIGPPMSENTLIFLYENHIAIHVTKDY